jgi:hypothetical protein
MTPSILLYGNTFCNIWLHRSAGSNIESVYRYQCSVGATAPPFRIDNRGNVFSRLLRNVSKYGPSYMVSHSRILDNLGINVLLFFYRHVKVGQVSFISLYSSCT